MNKFIKQTGIKDCGVCCIYNILKLNNEDISLEKLRDKTKTDKNGTSIYNMVKTFQSLNYESKAYETTIDNLKSINLPVICYININGYNHYIILKKIIKNKIYIFDPIRGNIKYSEEEFKKEFLNVIITCSKIKPLTNKKLSNYFISLLKTKSNQISIVLSFILFSSILSIVFSLYLKTIVENKSFFILFLFIIILFIKFIFNYIKDIFILKFNKNINAELRNNTYEKIFNLPILYHHNRPTGDIISKVNDLNYIKEFIYELSFSLILNILLTIFLIIFFIFYSFKNIIFIIIPILIIFINHLLKRNTLNNYIKRDIVNNTNVNISFIDSLFNIDTIKNLNLTKSFIIKNKKIYDKYLTDNNELNKKIINYTYINNIIIEFFNLIIIFININNSVSKIILINSLYIILFDSIKKILSIDNIFINTKESYNRINDLLNYDIKDGDKNIKSINKIEFINAYFSYDDKNYIIKNYNLLINNNEFILVNGKSGVGKSTLFKLLNKEIVLNKGSIKINNINIDNITNDSLKNNICFVNQNEKLFNDSIYNNILLYKKIDKKELDKILDVCLIKEFLDKKEINLNFMIEENGFNISGGERQKIILARSLLRNTNFIIFDETMNEIDIDSERKILKNIKTEYNKTIILISHRDNNKDLFDRIISIGGSNERVKCISN